MLIPEVYALALRLDREIMGELARPYDWSSDALLGPPPPAIWNPWGDVVPPQLEAKEPETVTISLRMVTLRVDTGAIVATSEPNPDRSR
jgi:hypothetical protein